MLISPQFTQFTQFTQFGIQENLWSIFGEKHMFPIDKYRNILIIQTLT
jgi:hypothetical protein